MRYDDTEPSVLGGVGFYRSVLGVVFLWCGDFSDIPLCYVMSVPSACCLPESQPNYKPFVAHGLGYFDTDGHVTLKG